MRLLFCQDFPFMRELLIMSVLQNPLTINQTQLIFERTSS